MNLILHWQKSQLKIRKNSMKHSELRAIIAEEVKQVLKEESNNYMFFANLKTIKHAVDGMLQMDPMLVDSMLSDGHGWALDHIATSTDDIDEVYHFLNAKQ